VAANTLELVDAATDPHCPYEAAEAEGDRRRDLTGNHASAARHRSQRKAVPVGVRVGRLVDGAIWAARFKMMSLARRILASTKGPAQPDDPKSAGADRTKTPRSTGV
jgi:hypothetical protein